MNETLSKIAKQTFVFQTNKGTSLAFYQPYLDEDMNVCFRYTPSIHKAQKIWIHEKKKEIVLEGKNGRRVTVFINSKNPYFFEDCMTFKQLVLDELKQYSGRMKRGEENIYLYPQKDSEKPFFFTAETIAEMGYLATKFNTGFLFFLEKLLNEKHEGYYAWQQSLRNKTQELYKIPDNKEYISVSLKELILKTNKKKQNN